MGAEITIHNSATEYNGQQFKTKVKQNVRITGERIDTSVENGHVHHRGNNKTMELSRTKYMLMECIAGLDGDKGTLTEEDFIKFKAKYANDKEFRNKIKKECNVTDVRQDAESGITTISFESNNCNYERVKTSMKVDFETSAEKAQREAYEKENKDELCANYEKKDTPPNSFLDKIINLFK